MSGRNRRTEKLIEENYGKDPTQGSTFYDASDRLDRIKRLHEALPSDPEDIDAITWNDLDMDQVFLHINHTNSFIGEQTLYHRLHRISLLRDKEQRDS